MHLKIVTVDQTIVDEEILSLLTASESGEFMILPDHSPLIALTVPAATVLTTPDKQRRVLYTDNGVLKILNNEILFITDSAQWKDQIDLAQAEADQRTAREAMKSGSAADKARAGALLARAQARLRAGRSS